MNSKRSDLLPTEVRSEYPFVGKLFEQPAKLSSGEPAVMHYLDEGDGPVVLMLHGNPTWSFYYRNLVQKLVSVGFRCIVPDHIGCGLSDKPQNYPYTLTRRIEDVERLVEHLGIECFSLVVHDWGGAIGCGLSGRKPEALEKLVLLNTAAFRSKRIPLRIAAVKLPVVGECIIRGLNGFAWPATWMAVKSRLSASIKKGYLWPYSNWSDRVALWNFVKDIPLSAKHPSYEQLAAVEMGLSGLKDKPVQILWGGKDFCFDDSFFKQWCRLFPDADVHLCKEFGHYILEDGGDEVLDTIRSFLSA